MNAKMEKRIRRKARELTVGMPERVLIGKRVVSTRTVSVDGQEVARSQAVNEPQSTRSVARAIKKGLIAERKRELEE